MAFSNERIEKLNGQRLARVHPTLAKRSNELIALAKAEGFELLIVQGLRTFAEQDAIYAQGRSRKGKIVTNARGGQSNHCYGASVDFLFITDGIPDWTEELYRNLGDWTTKVGLDWGGRWRTYIDLPHCELPNLPNWRVMLPVYKKGGLKAVWKMLS
ncbi:MAG: M15 family metallopeptidase [Acidobacteriota bacterium]|nr:M15 family metallopeptidase [Acidobacteriota bacterium]